MFIRRPFGKDKKGVKAGRIAAILAAILCAVAFLTAELPAHDARRETAGTGETIVLAALPSKYETPGRTPVLNPGHSACRHVALLRTDVCPRCLYRERA